MAAPGKILAEQAVNYMAPPIASVDASHVACTVCPEAQEKAAADLERHQREEAGALGEAIEQRDPTKLLEKDFLLEMAEGGIAAGPIGTISGAAIGPLVATRTAQKRTRAIIDQHRDEIALQLGISESAVDVRALMLAAKDNIALRRAIASIEDEKGAHPFVNIAGLLGMVGGAAVGSLIPIPFVGTLVGGGAGYWIGSSVAEKSIGPDQNKNPMVQMDELRAKLAEGKPLSAMDVFALRVSQNPALDANIISRFDTDFFSLSPQDKMYAMQMHGDLANQSARDAMLCNQGANIDDLMFGFMPESPVQEFAQLQEAAGEGKWAQKVGGSRAQRQGSHAEAIRAQQQAAAGQEPVLS